MCLFCTLCGLAMMPVTELQAKPKVSQSETKCLPNSMKKWFNHFQNIPFIMLLSGELFAFSGTVLPYYFLPNLAESSRVDSKMLVTIIGVGDITVRILTGLAIESSGIHPLALSAITLGIKVMQWQQNKIIAPKTDYYKNNFPAICAGFPLIMPQCQSYWSFMVTSALFGIFNASYAASVLVSITELCDISMIASAFGMLQLVYGLGVVLGTVTWAVHVSEHNFLNLIFK